MARGMGTFQREQLQADRNREIVDALDADEHLSYETVGARYGLTRQRVAQIVRQERKRREEVVEQPS